jgi:hypothetical protein
LELVKAYYGGWYTAFTTFTNALQFKHSGRSHTTKANEAAGLVARGMWSQYYIDSLYGEQLEDRNLKRRVVPWQASQ